MFHFRHDWEIVSTAQYEVEAERTSPYDVWRWELIEGNIRGKPTPKEWRTSVYKRCRKCSKTEQNVLKGKHTFSAAS